MSGALLGVLAELAGGSQGVLERTTDYLTGFGLLAAGAASVRLSRGTALLLVATALLWWLGSVLPEAIYLHRIPLFQAVAVYPGWRVTSKSSAVLASVFYVAVAIPAISETDTGTAAYGLAILSVALFRRLQTGSPSRGYTNTALLASVTLFAGTTVLAGLRWAASDPAQIARPTLIVYQMAIVASGLILWRGLRRPTIESIADIVIELDGTDAGPMRDQLRRLLGDPSLEVLYRTKDGAYLTTRGVPGEFPLPDSDRIATPIRRDGRDELIIIHDRATLQGADLLAAVESVTRLSTMNTALLAETRHRLRSLAESRQRLIVAEEEERSRLADQLRRRIQVSLDSTESRLHETLENSADADTRTAIRKALDQVRLTRQDVDAISEGLHPRALEGSLSEAIGTITAESPIPIEVTMPNFELPSAARTAIYYIASEAITNAIKHSRARLLELSVDTDGDSVVITVSDDGVGGADPAIGSGLAGLAERVTALGGHIQVESPTGGGTRLVAELPLGDQ